MIDYSPKIDMKMTKLSKFATPERSVLILEAILKSGANQYDTHAVRRIANEFGTSQTNIRAAYSRHAPSIAFVRALIEENQILRQENANLLFHRQIVYKSVERPQNPKNPDVEVDFSDDTIALMQSLGMLEVVC